MIFACNVYICIVISDHIILLCRIIYSHSSVWDIYECLKAVYNYIYIYIYIIIYNNYIIIYAVLRSINLHEVVD